MSNTAVMSALNGQIGKEFYSSHLYLSMAAFLESSNLPGFAAWMRLQAEEERAHAMRLFDYVVDSGGRITLEAIAAPPSDFGAPINTMERTLEHEQEITASINALYELAVKENDYRTQVQLQWFITEQAEEEKSVSDIVEQLKMAGDSGPALPQ